MAAEGKLQARVIKWLKSQPDCYHVKNHGSAFTRRGVPDLTISVGTQALWVELKAPGQKPTPRQAVEHDRIRATGGRVLVADTLEAVQEAVQVCRTPADSPL